jgi:hypothetical protein
MRTPRLLAGLAFVLATFAGGGWYGYAVWWPGHCLDRLAHCPPDQAEGWVERVARFGDGARPRLLDGLKTGDAVTCGRYRDVLEKLAESCPAGDPRGTAFVQQLAEGFPSFGAAGQCCALDLADTVCAGRQPQAREICGEMIAHALTQPAEEVRVKAVALLMARPDLGPPAAVVDRLGDASPAVRRAAMLAVGPSRNLIADDDLLRWLHDPDAEVRQLCETALRSRGLRAQDVRMGRLLTDARPRARLELLPYLRHDMDLDVSAWLRRLTLDPAPAVRAGAVRAAAEQQVAGLADRLAQMAGADPDPTVRENARYYLGHMRMEQPAGWQTPEVQR